MTRTLPLLALACAATLTACKDGHRDPRGVGRDEVLVQTSATATAESKPDEARFQVGMSSIGATGPAASQANAAKMSGVVAKLKALGVEDKDIQTSQLTIARLDYGPNRGRFEANNTVTVRMRDTAKAGEAIAAATGEGANVLSGPDFRVGDPEAATRSAYAAAYRAARARADAYAEAAGMKVARVLTIRDGAQLGQPVPYMAEADASARNVALQSAAPPVMAGTNSATVTVSADFALGAQ